MTNSPINTQKKNYLYLLWLYTLAVILWGAWVRISKSGDGCGDHWPLCAGEIIPNFVHKKTWIEFSHRMMSGLYGLIIIYIFIKFKKHTNSLFKKLNYLLLLFMISEALLGAVLVKGKLVTLDDSILRLFVMSLHQINSFMLTGITYLFYISVKENKAAISFKYKKLILLFLFLPLTGAIAALSTTLFPSISLWQGILADLSSNQHLFIQLRVLHPLIAILVAFGFIYFCINRNLNKLALEFSLALAVGLVTLLTLSPVYLKLAHLLIAHLLWAKLLHALVNLPDSNNR